MKTIKILKDVTTLEVGDKVLFGDLEYVVIKSTYSGRYYLLSDAKPFNDIIFRNLKIDKRGFIDNLGIKADCNVDFPETKSLEALTAIVSALFKEYEKQGSELPKTWEEFCKISKVGDKRYCIYNNVIMGTSISQISCLNKGLIESEQEAKAHIALMQLRQLRKAYVKDWEPDWLDDFNAKYCIEVSRNELLVHSCYYKYHALSFPSRKLAEQFLTNFKDLLETAKVLL